MNRIAKVGDVYALWNEVLQLWTLIQVIQENEKGNIALLDLENTFDEIPTATNLVDLKPLIINHHNWKGEYSCRYIGTKRVPKRIIYIGNNTPILDLEIRSYSIGWPKNVLQVILQHQWNQLPKSLRVAYKTAKASKETVEVGGRSRRIDSTTIYIEPEDEILLTELQKMPALTDIYYRGTSNELIPLVEKNPLISTLEWKEHRQKVVDISRTNIRKLELDVTFLEELILNASIRSMSFIGDLEQLNKLKIHHPLGGKFLEVDMYLLKSNIELPNLNLPNLEEIRLVVNQIDIKQLVSFYPNLRTIAIWGNPGIIHHFNYFGKFKHLEHLQLNDLFGFGKQDFPAPEMLPHLEFLWLTSIPKEAGTYAKKHFKEVSSLSVTKLRNEKWLAENLNNPFRSWDGREGISTANAKKAFKAFKVLNSGIEKQSDKETIVVLFSNFIDVFNKMDTQGVIDTMAREEIYEVYMELAKKSSINEQELFEVFEKNRDF